MKIIRAKDYADLSRKAASIIASQIILKPNSVLGLATGSSPEGTYKELVRRYNEGELDFSQVRSVNLDEYVGLDAKHDQSYAYFMHHHLFDHVNIDVNNTNLPDGTNLDTANETARYDAVIRSMNGVVLQLLGLGPNGHIGFNEPDDHFSFGTRCVDLAETTIQANSRFFASANDVPRQAYSMGIYDIMMSKHVLLVVSGENKAQAVKDCFFGPIKPQNPGSILQLHPHCTVVADEAALSLVQDLL